MKYAERVTPIGAAAGALTTLLCCLPLAFGAAAATAMASGVFAALRPWLLAASAFLLALGFVQLYVGKRSCERRTPLSVAILWISTAIVLLIILFPQLVASVVADMLPASSP